ncbi:MAG: DUF1294 domain-containing protein [Clostridia bacterium]|nr:DUF1294 domain-containing protein [Clostridia bacterium]
MRAAFLALWLVINAVAFLLYGADKRRARKGQWRITERTLLLSAWLLGGVGALAGMRVFRHKTKHLAFRVCVPLGALLSMAALAAGCFLLK